MDCNTHKCFSTSAAVLAVDVERQLVSSTHSLLIDVTHERSDLIVLGGSKESHSYDHKHSYVLCT